MEPIPNTGVGHLPPHEANGVKLLRVYLAVDYDYTENRVMLLISYAPTSRVRNDPTDPTRILDRPRGTNSQPTFTPVSPGPAR